MKKLIILVLLCVGIFHGLKYLKRAQEKRQTEIQKIGQTKFEEARQQVEEYKRRVELRKKQTEIDTRRALEPSWEHQKYMMEQEERERQLKELEARIKEESERRKPSRERWQKKAQEDLKKAQEEAKDRFKNVKCEPPPYPKYDGKIPQERDVPKNLKEAARNPLYIYQKRYENK